MLVFGINTRFNVIVSANVEFNTERKTKLQSEAENNINNAVIQTYPVHLDRPIRSKPKKVKVAHLI